MLEDRPSELNPVEVVLPRTANELDETTLEVGIHGTDKDSPENGEVNWGGGGGPAA